MELVSRCDKNPRPGREAVVDLRGTADRSRRETRVRHGARAGERRVPFSTALEILDEEGP